MKGGYWSSHSIWFMQTRCGSTHDKHIGGGCGVAPPSRMKLLSWNSWKLGNPQKIWVLHNLIQREVPDLLFLQETKLRTHKMEFIKFRLGFTNCLGVDCDGKGRGLALMWHIDMDITILHYFKHHIQASIKIEDSSQWTFIGLYGHPVATCRSETWALLRSLQPGEGLPWLVGGDFNEVKSNANKWGGNPHPEG